MSGFRSSGASLERRLMSLRRGERISMHYRNADGELSERTVLVNRVYTSRYGKSYLEGYCSLAAERRTFRADRILSIDRPEDSEGSGTERATPQAQSASRSTFRPGRSAPVPEARGAIRRSEGSATGSPAGGGHRRAAFPVIVTVAAAIVVAGVLGISGQSRNDSAPVSPVETATRRALEHPGTPPAQTFGSRPAGAHSPAKEGQLIYRDLAIRTAHFAGGLRYAIPTLGISTPTLRDAHLLINARLFEQRTGIHDLRLEAIYCAADTDGNGNLSWAEIVEFQKAIHEVFSYKSNLTALRPDRFLDERGGDCEDWALFAAGLLHFWGWNASIAVFAPPGGGTGHAVVFVWVPQPIPGIGSYTVPAPAKAGSTPILPGTYIPIDYDDVGGLSNAVGKGWHLSGLCDPESLYGRVM